MQGKKQDLRLECLAALEQALRNVLTILGLMPTSYSEVVKFNFFVISLFVSVLLQIFSALFPSPLGVDYVYKFSC